MSRLIDLAGQRFGRLTVLRQHGSDGRIHWRCRCECGREITVRGSHLKSGATRSCGCYRTESSRILGFSTRSHGHSAGGMCSPTYRSFQAMRQRCLNPNHARFADYGGRGVTICEEWSRFEQFLADMGERPEGTSLDRIDTENGNYEPGACRWATPKEQASNRRRRK